MTVTAEIQALKEAHRKTWAPGDYPGVALSDKAAPYYRRRWTSVDRSQAIRHSPR